MSEQEQQGSRLVDVEAERAVLAVLFAQVARGPAAVRDALDAARLTPEEFGQEAHAHVYRAVERLARAGQVPDHVAIAGELRRTGVLEAVGGVAGLVRLDRTLALDSSLGQHAQTVRAMATRRRLVAEAQRIIQDAHEPSISVDTLLAEAPARFAKLERPTEDWQTGRAAFVPVADHIQAVSEGKKDPVHRTGIRALDTAIGGLPQNLTVVLAQPGVGKGALIAALIKAQANIGQRPAIMSLEDRRSWLGFRLLADASGVDAFLLRNRKLNAARWEAVGAGFARVYEWADNWLLNDREGLTPGQVLASAREAVRLHGATSVMVDNLRAIRWPRERVQSKQDAILEFLSEGRTLATSLGVPFVVFHHVKRRDGLGPATMPEPTDAADASGVETIARMMLGIARERDSATVEVGVIKANEGPSGDIVALRFQKQSAMIADMDGPQASLWGGEG